MSFAGREGSKGPLHRPGQAPPPEAERATLRLWPKPNKSEKAGGSGWGWQVETEEKWAPGRAETRMGPTGTRSL